MPYLLMTLQIYGSTYVQRNKFRKASSQVFSSFQDRKNIRIQRHCITLYYNMSKIAFYPIIL